MFEKPSNKKLGSYLIWFIVFIFIIILSGYFVKNFLNKEKSVQENFNMGGSLQNTPINDKQEQNKQIQDYVLMDMKMQEYEKKNNCEGGYINLGWPPENPINSYPTLDFHPKISPEQENSIVYGDPFDKNFKNAMFI